MATPGEDKPAPPVMSLREIREGPGEEADTSIEGIRRRRIQRAEEARGQPLTFRQQMLIKDAPVPVSVEFGVLLVFILAAIFFVTFVFRDAHPEKRLLTKPELEMYDGERFSKIYLAVLGQVFDVTKGRKHYGPNGGYSFFRARDASKAYVTGDFENDLVDDVKTLSAEDLHSLVGWRDFYHKHKDYKFVGKLVGRFYNKKGEATKELLRVEKVASEAPQAGVEPGYKPQGVPCTERWTSTQGVLSCKDAHPRQVFESAAAKLPRCLCFGSTMFSNERRLFPGCEPDAESCRVQRFSG